MRMYDLIYKKRQGHALSDAEIQFMIDGFVKGTIPDYQMAAMAMAIVWRSMNDEETVALTDAIAHSGDCIDLSDFENLSVDKHSTGGVGDKTTLIVAPIVAACGAKLAKMSGRGLGHTGGTVDKLESIEGYQTQLSYDEFLAQSDSVGVCVVGQSSNLTPADKKLYALRDLTATVDSIPLIVSSIMGKKLAAGARNIVLDVKMGSGAFIKDIDSATELAQKMVTIGKRCGRNMTALITNMDMPLGYAIGNALEVREAISVLRENTPGDLRDICLALSANMLALCFDIAYEAAYEKAQNALQSGRAFEKFKQWITAQKGNAQWVENTDLFPTAAHSISLCSERGGYISHMDTEQIGAVCCILGAGRQCKEDTIDFAAGILLRKKTGDSVQKGEELAVLYSNDEGSLSTAAERFSAALNFDEKKPPSCPLIYKTIR